MIEVRQADIDDISNIMAFIDEYWQKGHILGNNREFFEWQFVNGSHVNMLIGEDTETKKIYGIVGIIIYSNSSNPDASGTLWKTIKSENPVLALELEEKLYTTFNTRHVCSPGMRERAVSLYKKMGYSIVKMDHYYRLADRKSYEIATIKDKRIPSVRDTGYNIKPIAIVDEMKNIIPEDVLQNSLLSKDYDYVEKRYFRHPIYEYEKWAIIDDNAKSVAVLITREESVGKHKSCKIVDYYGENKHIGQITSRLDELINEREYEFIDVYSYGIDTNIYDEAGFVCCNDENDINVIPNYFHPFEKRNIPRYFVNNYLSGLRMFRGDGDQDRPC